jgi:hypothetical protein
MNAEVLDGIVGNTDMPPFLIPSLMAIPPNRYDM